MFISDAWAQAAAPAAAGSSVTGIVIQLVGIVLVFYLLLIRPQQKKMKQHEAQLKAIKVGDEILTGGGLYAKVKKIDGDDITAEIAQGLDVKMYRYTIRDVLNQLPQAGQADKSKKTAEDKAAPKK